MTNEKIVEQWNNDELSHYELVELARQDEREKLQTEIGHLEYKIEGLQQALSRNRDEREKMQGVEVPLNAGDYVINSKRQLKQIHSIEPRENDNLRYNFTDGSFGLKNEKHLGGLQCGNYTKIDVSAVAGSLQGVDVWVSWDEDYFGEHPNPKISDDEPVEWVAGQFDIGGCDMRTEIFESFATMLGIEQGQCKKFRIVEVGE